MELIDGVSTCRGVCREDVWHRVGHGIGHHASHGESTEVELVRVDSDIAVSGRRCLVVSLYLLCQLLQELSIVVLLACSLPAGRAAKAIRPIA